MVKNLTMFSYSLIGRSLKTNIFSCIYVVFPPSFPIRYLPLQTYVFYFFYFFYFRVCGLKSNVTLRYSQHIYLYIYMHVYIHIEEEAYVGSKNKKRLRRKREREEKEWIE